jgi:predicted nucleotidyltransferase
MFTEFDDEIIRIILKHYPDTIAVLLFGSFGTPDARPDSDTDIALLFPYGDKRDPGFSDCRVELEELLGRTVDLVDLREVSTVFQNEILNTARELYISSRPEFTEFGGLVLSFYQGLNEERAEILAEFGSTGRAYKV